jgi:hypothetical protein
MEWDKHDKWAKEIFGISDEVSNEVNRAVDYSGDNNLPPPPQEYKEALSKCKDMKKSKGSKSAFSMVAAHYAKNTHDSGISSKTGSDIAAEYELCAMRQLSSEHVKAWHLHYYLDYLDKEASQEETLRELLNRYQLDHSHYLCSSEVKNKILKYEDKIAAEVGTSVG